MRAGGRSTSAAGRREQAGALGDLRDRLAGRLLLPGGDGYDPASAPANGRYRSIRPLAVAQCAGVADVITCVNWSRENGIPPVARGGGHSYAGYSTTLGLLIDIGNLNSVTIDRAQGTAVTGGAARNQQLYDATHDGPLFLPGGTCLGVGVGGLVLGGGIGYNTHWAGLTSDHLLGTEIVTASGDLLAADASHYDDLYWACRGSAGGNFGINTAFSFELLEAPQNIAWYRFDWHGAEAAGAVMAAFHQMLQTAPPALNAVAMAQASEIGSGGPRETIDVFSRGQYIGAVDELRDLVSPLLPAATPTRQVIQQQTFWDTVRMINSPEPESHSFGDISRYAAEPLPDSVISKLIDVLAACPSRTDTANGSLWSLGWVGGDVVNAIGRTETAYVHRNMLTLLRPTTVWPDDAPASVGEGLNAWTNAMIAVLAPFTPCESYQNFPNRSLLNMGAALLRRELRASGGGEDEVRRRQPLPQRAEHSDQERRVTNLPTADELAKAPVSARQAQSVERSRSCAVWCTQGRSPRSRLNGRRLRQARWCPGTHGSPVASGFLPDGRDGFCVEFRSGNVFKGFPDARAATRWARSALQRWSGEQS